MAPSTFHHFSRLPLELRYGIWTLAVQPRLVLLTHSHFFTFTHNYNHEPILTPISVLKKDHPNHNYLFSRSPIPAPLHTCRESRHMMLDLGYELAFGTEEAEPFTWFNFQIDTLYLIKAPMLRDELYARKEFELASPREETLWNATKAGASFPTILPKDIRRIQRIAVMDTTTVRDPIPGPMFISSSDHERSLELYELVLRFGSLSELLIVEKHVGNKVRDRRGDLWDYVECNGIDAKVVVWPHGRLLSLVHYWRLHQYAKANRGDWSGYFRYFEKEWEEWFMSLKELASTAPQPRPPSLPPIDYRPPVRPSASIGTIPKVMVVAVMPRTEANKLITARDSYWYEKARQVDVKGDEISKKKEEEEEEEAQSYWGRDYEAWKDIPKDSLYNSQAA